MPYAPFSQSAAQTDIIHIISHRSCTLGIHGQTTGEWVGSELISALSAAVSRGSHEIYLMLLEAGVKLQGVFMMDSKYLTCLPIVTDMIQVGTFCKFSPK
ncbi:hypothetical protein DPMN_182171 [Dreissena polymorpha]|uniref:Uncharacterized protein n=1 Tax=Dreissena polymorpha TaxID=45954 RepID=A0A9D4DF00_DREPO|nr:hypothetical protein DPMN_182171 [Dreissena polymorpha]